MTKARPGKPPRYHQSFRGFFGTLSDELNAFQLFFAFSLRGTTLGVKDPGGPGPRPLTNAGSRHGSGSNYVADPNRALFESVVSFLAPVLDKLVDRMHAP